MKPSKIIIAIFGLVALAQLFVPAQMIWNREQVLVQGVSYKFKTEPIDPVDPFRGRYVWLNFSEDRFQPTAEEFEAYEYGEAYYLSFEVDAQGFAKIVSADSIPPADTEAFLKTEITYKRNWDSTYTLQFDYPFDQFYMEESIAPIAEEAFRAANRDSIRNTYAIVRIHQGTAIVDEVMVDDIPLGTWAQEYWEALPDSLKP
ncbi:GDYXXLXY domain-containing protein [Pontibacter sp. G13]|uniref:GDYXXLXY domain-containing protein n=1 Tax=Pontibacter sp. G13 TaxID=3074898 RepID=UPI00288C5E49|nr:GDYXXLXY domain-containing protein [Pontibacter sp. G13]WNJ17633.1 GDYXXLXY domain-containing protein [Pontibacter sp. G13]